MMNNEEEKRCPLCAEEMDWTDQQFMPCKCGYQICVWCWHQIIDMAEKDETEGRCPACRIIYDKEKIVAMQANCERAMTKNSSKKSKPPKAKPKTIEVKKDLTNVRVIQRKMAYVIGLPLSLADEDVLVRKEYFGQYGKVTKVSLSRTAGGAIQQFINDSSSVYITYSKEEEALRCIQSVHGFILDGRLLRASFGTAKYCHAWLKNMPCNNHACLYLHSIGADEDSFGKDEVAAVHTRSRVQQIVGGTSDVGNRSGNVLPPPVLDIYNSTIDKSTVRSTIYDAAHGSASCTVDILPVKEKEGGTTIPHKMTTFVDIVGRSNSSPPEKDGFLSEDKRVSDICSDLSSVAINGDIRPGEPYSFPTPVKVSSSNHIDDGLSANISEEKRILNLCPDLSSVSIKEDIRPGEPYSVPTLFNSKHVENGLCENIPEEPPTEDTLLVHKKSNSVDGFSTDQDPVHNPLGCVNSMLNDSSQELRFQNSAKSDRIYRGSNSFSNEEIVEHLRRIDGDNLTNDGESAALDAIESNIISNIMSIDFDLCDDSLTMRNGFSELLDENDGLGGSSWNSVNSDQSGPYSFVKQDGFASQMAESILPDYRDNKDHYLSKPQFPVSRAQSLVPPGFSVPSSNPPPGFSASERTGLARPSSGSRLVNFPNTLHQTSSTRTSSTFHDVDFFDPAILSCGKVNPTNGYKNPRLSTFEDESRLWLMMQQQQQQPSSSSAHQDSKFPQMFTHQMQPMQQEPSYNTGLYMGNNNGLSGLDNNNIYGLNRQQNSDSSFFSQMSQQKYGNGHISNHTTNGYMHHHNSLDEASQHKGEVGLTDIPRNERLGGLNNYFPGYGDLMFNTGDMYTRVFGL